MSDDQLTLGASHGDREAFGMLYERYFRGVYDLSVRMVRDPDAALDIVQNTFLSAWQNLQKRTVRGNVKAWLYTIARNTAIDELRRSKRLHTTAFSESESTSSLPFDRIDTSRVSDPQSVLQDQDLVDLVWTSAAALNPKEYSLLDMHLRKDLAPDEIATSLGVSRGTIHTQISRLRDSLGESVATALLIRRGRQDCPDLNAILLERQFAGLDQDDRRAVTRHSSECQRCQESRKRYVAPAEIFSGLALVPVTDEVRAALWLQISAAAGAGGAAIGFIGAIGEKVAGWWAGSSPSARGAAFGGGGIAAAGLVAFVLLVSTSGGGEVEDQLVAPAVKAFPSSLPGSQLPAEERPTSTSPPTSTPTPAPAPATTSTPTLTPTPTPAPVAAEALASPAPTTAATTAASTPTPGPTPAPIAPPIVVVSVDIRVPVNLTSRLVLKTTIFGTDAVPVANFAAGSLTLGGARPEWFRLQDADGDGDLDLVLQFRPDVAPIGALVCIEGKTLTGFALAGCDSARIVPSGA